MDLLVLGTAQDGGYPQAGCSDACCRHAWKTRYQRLIASLAFYSRRNCFLIDVTPDFKYQYQLIEKTIKTSPHISGIFITHAHLGHYAGLLEFGLEVMNSDAVPVYVMPKMKSFLENNAPFSQLVSLKNINLVAIEENQPIEMNGIFSITPFQVPHRNEFSETVGYSVQSSSKSVLYIPDIDSWEEWDTDINNMINKHDIAFLDGTFYDKKELKKRDIKDVPHPSILESMKKFSSLDVIDRQKVNFTHLNHTNNVLRINSKERNEVLKQGFKIATDGENISI